MQTYQESGLYRIRLCTGGLWHTVTLDDYFPCTVDSGTPIFSRANGAEMWVLLLEKAMAKLSGNYFRLRGGLAAEGLMDLTGFPTFRFKFKNVLVKKMVKDGTLFEKIVFADKNSAVACASTPGEDRFTEGKTVAGEKVNFFIYYIVDDDISKHSMSLEGYGAKILGLA